MKRTHPPVLLLLALLASACTSGPTGNLPSPTATPSPSATTPPLREAFLFSSTDQSSNSDVYLAESFDSAAVRLTTPPSGSTSLVYNDHPVFSPDGTRIAFDSNRDVGGYTYQIYVMQRDGSQITRLMESGCGKYPAWSPDGQKIAFLTCGDKSSDLAIMNTDGSQLNQLTSSGIVKSRPSWSPDSRFLVFVGSNPAGTDSLYVINVDGSNLTCLEQTNTPVDAVAGSPVWSPDGKSIAWSVGSKTEYKYISQIMLLQVDNPTTPHLLSADDQLAGSFSLTWSPDGRKLMGISVVNGPYMIDANGSNITNPVYNNPDLFWLIFRSTSLDWFMPGMESFAGVVSRPISGQGVSQDMSSLMRICTERTHLASQPEYIQGLPPHPLAAFLLEINANNWTNAAYPGLRLPRYDVSAVQLVACIQESFKVVDPCEYSATGYGVTQRTIERSIQVVNVEIFSAQNGVVVDQFSVDGPSANPCPPTVGQYENSPNLNGGVVDIEQVYSILDNYYNGNKP